MKQLETSNRATIQTLEAFPSIDRFLPYRDHLFHFLEAHHCLAGLDHELFPATIHPALRQQIRITAFNHLADSLKRGGRSSIIRESWRKTKDAEALWNSVAMEFGSSARTKGVERARHALEQVIQRDGVDTLMPYIEEFTRATEHLRSIQRCEGRDSITAPDELDLWRSLVKRWT